MNALQIIFFCSLIIFSRASLSQDVGNDDDQGMFQDIPQDPATDPAKDPWETATDSAAREMGRVIGRRLGQETIKHMTKEDRLAMLDRARSATRGEMIRHYNFEDSPYYNALSGYVTVLREGTNHQKNRCLEYEVDLVYRMERYFFRPVMCETSKGEWLEFPLSDITFPNRGEPSPFPGGWLPPVH